MSKVVRDITERKKTEEALRRREQQLEEAQSLAQMGSFEWNIVEDTFHFSTELYRMYDLPPASEATFETAMARAILTTVSKSLTPRVAPLEGAYFRGAAAAPSLDGDPSVSRSARPFCPIIHAMNRVRVSTTVDAHKWATARRLLGAPSSQIVDRALTALIDQLETAHERAVLTASPYEDDPDLAWQAPLGRSLPYEGEVPADVVRLAKQRRSKQGKE